MSFINTLTEPKTDAVYIQAAAAILDVERLKGLIGNHKRNRRELEITLGLRGYEIDMDYLYARLNKAISKLTALEQTDYAAVQRVRRDARYPVIEVKRTRIEMDIV